MKKFGKFMFAALSAAAFAGSAYYLVKNVINKDSSDEFDDFEDEFDDFNFNDEGEADTPAAQENREYVTLNISKEEEAAPDEEASESEAEAPEEEVSEKDASEEDSSDSTEE